MTAQSIYSKGPRQQSQARNLISNVTPARLSIQQTVERWSAEDVIVEGPISFVRSKFSAHRYYTVVGTTCTCERENCPHIQKVVAYRAANVQEVEPVKQPSPSQAKKMVQVDSAEKVIVQGDAILVQSCRFIGWAYTVNFDYARAQYVCSCGNPKCSEHVGVVKEYTAAQHAAQLAAAPAQKDVRGSAEWYADQFKQCEDVRQVVRDEKVLVAQTESERASVVVDAITAKINAQFGKVVVRRGIVALSQKEAA